ncbi:MAG: protein translocase subunit SecD [Corynebacterium sp.]|nr:protein translocase subunit SecD [Corynebacterium sp.]
MARSARLGLVKGKPKTVVGLFLLLVIIIYVLIFTTGSKSPTPKLGIDLQGGTRVTLVPQGQTPTQDQLTQARQILENRVNGMGVSGASVVVDGNTLVITVPGSDSSEARSLGQTSQLYFRPVTNPSNPDPSTLMSVLEDMANRWVAQGVITADQANSSMATMAQQLSQSTGTTVNPPTVTSTAPAETTNSVEAADRRAKVTEMLRDDRQSTDGTKQIAAAALMQCNADTSDPIAGTDDPTKPLVACDPSSGQKYVLDEVPLLVGQTDPVNGKRLTGDEIDTSKPITGGYNAQAGQMQITFAFKSGDGDQGAATWYQVTSQNLQNQVAITLDSEIISAPVIQSATPVGSSTAITGQFTQAEAQELANNLRYGALPLSFAGANGEKGGTAITIPATLGWASLKAGLIAGVIGLILVALYALIYYRFLGIYGIISLIASGALVYGALVLLGRWIGYSLDLAGIAGLIIGIGTTADSFVVFYARIKDEIRAGRSFRSAVPRAWDRAKHTILSGNLVSLIASIVLYILAVGDVKGFAFTLGLTTFFDMVLTFMVTAPLVILISRRAWIANPAWNGFGRAFRDAEAARKAGTLEEDEAIYEGTVVEDVPATTASDDARKES